MYSEKTRKRYRELYGMAVTKLASKYGKKTETAQASSKEHRNAQTS